MCCQCSLDAFSAILPRGNPAEIPRKAHTFSVFRCALKGAETEKCAVLEMEAEGTTPTPQKPSPQHRPVLQSNTSPTRTPEAISRNHPKKLTLAIWRMSYFSRSAVKAAAMGRPLSEPVKTFVALLYARLHGYSRSRAVEIINADPDAASGLQWNLAQAAHADGCMTAQDFEAWLQRDVCTVLPPEKNTPQTL